MNITSVTTAESESPQPATGGWQVASLVEASPLRFFRQVAHLSFETGGMADLISIDPGNTTLKAVFQPYDYDALDPDGPSEATLTASGGSLVVALDAPRHVRQVRLSSGTVTGPGYSVDLYRVDGGTPSEKPATSIGVQNNVATLPSDVDFTDLRFAIRLDGPAGPPLKAGDLTGLQVRGYPTGPRLGISDPNDLDSAVFFWQVSGEVGKAVPAGQGNVDAGEALAAALGRYLDDLFVRLAEDSGEDGQSPPQLVDVALIAASDAPCILDITAFDVTYHLVCRSFPSREDKQVLRFPGDQTTVREVPVKLPGRATVTSATLETVESLRRDRTLTSDQDAPDATPVQNEGICVGAGRWVAQGITPPQAASISGVGVALMALSSNTELLVEMREDWNGKPSGRRLAAGRIHLEQAGRRCWATLLFPDVVGLPSSLHWLLVKAAGGRAVWLAEVGGGTPARTLEETDDSNVWAEPSRLDGLQALYRLYSRGRQAREHPPVSLAIGTQAATAASEQNDARTYDLTSSLNAYLDDSPSSPPMATIPLAFTSALPGLITVYPPIIGYDLE